MIKVGWCNRSITFDDIVLLREEDSDWGLFSLVC
jgi:hypothetical protein